MLNLALDLVTTYWVINLPLIIPFAKRNIREYACQVYLRNSKCMLHRKTFPTDIRYFDSIKVCYALTCV